MLFFILQSIYSICGTKEHIIHIMCSGIWKKLAKQHTETQKTTIIRIIGASYLGPFLLEFYILLDFTRHNNNNNNNTF